MRLRRSIASALQPSTVEEADVFILVVTPVATVTADQRKHLPSRAIPTSPMRRRRFEPVTAALEVGEAGPEGVICHAPP
ncbi:MAG: hypothetical protein OK455_03105, partial [Thaumarchaeota archaeon]|nr:hypothetical protein [Nitrososphaerota archaeon]